MQHIRRAVKALFLVASILAAIRLTSGALGGSRRDRLRKFNKHILNPFALRVIAHRKTYYGVVHHVGRHSGKPYQTPVVAKLTGTGVIVPLPYGEDTDWCLNVLAAGSCTLVLNGETYALTAPRVVTPEVAEPLVPTINARLWHMIGVKRYLLLEMAATAASTAEGSAQAVAA